MRAHNESATKLDCISLRALTCIARKTLTSQARYRLSTHNEARWLSWLERRPVTAEVEGSNPFRVAYINIIFSGS